MATADGGVVAASFDDPTQVVKFDQNGNAVEMLRDLPTYSWKGAYGIGSTVNRAAKPSPMGNQFGAVANGNLTGNGTYINHPRFGLAWCGTTVPGGLSACGDSPPPAGGVVPVDMRYLYHNTCRPSNSDVDFGEARPDWVMLIRNAALGALERAFAHHGVIVEAASKHGKRTWAECQADPLCVGTDRADQGDVIRVAGNTTTPGTGQTYNAFGLLPGFWGYVNKSDVFYHEVMLNAVQAEWDNVAPDDKSWCPSYPPHSASDERRFAIIMRTIGRGIGNAAARELGHHFVKFNDMDCGPSGTKANDVCPGKDNFVYNYYLLNSQPNDPNNPDAVTNGGLFFYGLDAKQIHWSDRNECYLMYWTKYIPQDADAWYMKFLNTAIAHNSCSR